MLKFKVQILNILGNPSLIRGTGVATGTPSGIGPIEIDDKIDIVIEGIGTLSNTVLAEEWSGEQR
jgi:2-keto-4-pentenoate hydratase/2-oxohepta-3-ene-1,7-dioic acid hydratase in catechol pathway